MCPIIISVIGVIIANIIFTIISYGSLREAGYLTYVWGSVAALTSMFSWIFLIKRMPSKHIFLINTIWDVAVTVFCIILPFIMYHIKVEPKTLLGVLIAVIGLLVAKM